MNVSVFCRPLPRSHSTQSLSLTSSRAVFLGIALDSLTKNRLVGVSFYFEELRTGAFTDSLGVARFRDLPLGWHRIMIRRIGYAQRRDTIQVSPVSGTVAVYELPRRKVQMCDVVITR
jgi:hypothetical protein